MLNNELVIDVIYSRSQKSIVSGKRLGVTIHGLENDGLAVSPVDQSSLFVRNKDVFNGGSSFVQTAASSLNTAARSFDSVFEIRESELSVSFRCSTYAILHRK